MKNPTLLKRKRERARAISGRCHEAGVEPPQWVKSLLQIRPTPLAAKGEAMKS